MDIKETKDRHVDSFDRDTADVVTSTSLCLPLSVVSAFFFFLPPFSLSLSLPLPVSSASQSLFHPTVYITYEQHEAKLQQHHTHKQTQSIPECSVSHFILNEASSRPFLNLPRSFDAIIFSSPFNCKTAYKRIHRHLRRHTHTHTPTHCHRIARCASLLFVSVSPRSTDRWRDVVQAQRKPSESVARQTHTQTLTCKLVQFAVVSYSFQQSQVIFVMIFISLSSLDLRRC